MTKLIGKTVCTDCKKEHDVEINLDDITIEKLKIPQVTNATVQTEPQTNTEQPKPKTKIKKEFSVPSHIPKYQCKDGSCGRNHDNKGYKNPPNQVCENCGQFNYNSKECPFCGKDEMKEVDIEELEELGIPIPKHEEHDHDHDHDEENDEDEDE